MSDIQQAQLSEDFTMLVLNTAPELEENLIDYLLSFEQVEGFTSYQVHGHGEHRNLSVTEQVTGRRKRSQYEICHCEGVRGASLCSRTRYRLLGTDGPQFWSHRLG